MESLFQFYLNLGFEHILDWEGYDHIAYVIALCAIFQLSDWKKTALLVTAFTLGHSLTLALVGLDIIQLTANQKGIIETLIPLTIIATAVLNIFSASKKQNTFRFAYALTAFFGLIHGLGFSSFFRSSIMPGEEGTLITQLFAFNIGVELGQLIIVGIVLILSFFFINIVGIRHKDWVQIVSSLAILVGVKLLFG